MAEAAQQTRIDIPSILAQAVADDAAAQPPPPPSDPRDSDPAGPIITPLDLVHALLQDYIALDKHEYVAMALWAVHTHAYDQFFNNTTTGAHQPRPWCGKSISSAFLLAWLLVMNWSTTSRRVRSMIP